MKKIKLFAVLLCIVFACALFVGCTPRIPDGGDGNGNGDGNGSNGDVNATQIKNVIIIIGDGMGFNHIANAKTYFGDENVFPFEDNYFCQVTTRSFNKEITDSAAAATALATGNKVNNGNVSRFDGVDLTSIMQIAQEQGKKTGIITSDHLYGATPAGFSSHADNRNDTEEIVAGQATSGIDLMVGKTDQDGYYTAQRELFESNGYQLVSKYADLFDVENGQKVVANIGKLRSTYNSELSDQKSLDEVVNYALNALDCENGFCLMIENAYVDKRSHDNDLYGAMCEVRALSDTISTVLEFCKNRNDTVVLVTADHETGGLTLAASKEEIDEKNNSLYTKTSHSQANVPLYVFGYNLTDCESIDNTDIFRMCKTLIANSGELRF